MSFNHFMSNNVTEKVVKNYQPIFPLIYDNKIGPYKSITSLKESIQKDFEYLLLTNPGEWPMNPDLGIGARRFLFEGYNSPELSKVEERIRNQLEKYLPPPFIQFISAKFISTAEQQDQGLVNLEIKYAILNTSVVATQLDEFNISSQELSFSDLNKDLIKEHLDRAALLRSNMRTI